MFALELGRRCATVVSNAAHPGWARTNLQSSGPGRPLNGFENFVQNLFSQDAADGALPIVRAATAADTASGDYFGPSGIMELTGDPVLLKIPKPALDVEASRRLWEAASKLTGVYFAH